MSAIPQQGMDISAHKQDWASNLLSMQNILAHSVEAGVLEGTSDKDLLFYITRINKAKAGIIFSFDADSNSWVDSENLFVSQFKCDPQELIQEASEPLHELFLAKKSAIEQVKSTPGYNKFLITPVVYNNTIQKFVCLIAESLRHEDTIRQLVALQQSIGYFLYANLLNDNASNQWGFEQSSALLEILQKSASAKDFEESSQALANELQKYLGCTYAAIAESSSNRSRVVALSNTANFDRRGNRVKAMELAMNEALINQNIIEYPSTFQESQESYAKSKNTVHDHQELQFLLQASKIITLPLKGNSLDQSAGCATFIWSGNDSYNEDQLNIIQASKPYLEGVFNLAKHAKISVFSRAYHYFRDKMSAQQKWIIAGIAGMVGLILFLPFTYKISTQATLEPVLVRQIEAPFKSTLRQAFVEPGSIVNKGDLLAQLEERDLLSQLAEYSAGREQALKESATALAEKNPSEARIAQLEAQKLGAKIDILNQRKEKLRIVSPISGIVVQGDLERFEGSPLKIGERLLEIAPLDRMYIQVAIPEEDIRHVEIGMPVILKLDAFPGTEWDSTIKSINPTAETRDAINVFVAEAELSNFTEDLRPGMKGDAKISTIEKPLYWILLHKAWDFVRTLLFW